MANFHVIKLLPEDVPGASLGGRVPSDCKVIELKRWLECRGEKLSGLKNDLILRVNECIKMGKTQIDPKVDGGIHYEAKKVALVNAGTLDDVPIGAECPQAGWKPFPSIPIPKMFNYGNVYFYVVEELANVTLEYEEEDEDEEEECQETKEDKGYATAKPLTKGRRLLSSEFIHNTQNHQDESCYHLSGMVHHSMKSDKPLHAIVSISKMSGFVKRGTCTCKAQATGRCCHVTALLLFLSDHVREKGYDVDLACTSKPCVWNVGQKKEKNPQPFTWWNIPQRNEKCHQFISLTHVLLQPGHYMRRKTPFCRTCKVFPRRLVCGRICYIWSIQMFHWMMETRIC